MKKFYQTEKYKSYSEKKAIKALKHRMKRKRVTKAERRSLQGKSRYIAGKELDKKRFKSRVTAPENFSLIHNPEEVIDFINLLEASYYQKKSTFVILKNVSNIDHSGILLLLSVMYKFKESHVKFSGDFPRDEKSSQTLIDSGFFLHLQISSNNTPRYIISENNKILTTANKKVDTDIAKNVVDNASENIWGTAKKINSKGLYRVLMELMQNTHNHASQNQGRKHWWLSVNNKPEEKAVGFTFLDHGQGIMSNLHNKKTTDKWYGWKEKLRKTMGSRTDDEVLRLLLEGKLHEVTFQPGTSSGKYYRGKGIPGTYKVLKRRQIDNLYIVTNNVYTDVSKGKFRLLRNSFSGTFYYWELSINNDKKQWVI